MELRFELLQDPPHSIGLTPSDFYLFSNLERWPRRDRDVHLMKRSNEKPMDILEALTNRIIKEASS